MKTKIKNWSLKVVIVTIIMLLGVQCFFAMTKKHYVHYKNKDYCFVFVQTGSGSKGSNHYSGTMSVVDYNKWLNGKDGTVFVYQDSKAKYGTYLNIESITNITNYGDTPYAYD